MADKRYNGWTNYETWNVALWIGNDQGSYEYWEKEQAREAWDRSHATSYLTHKEAAAYALANQMKDEFEEAMGNVLDNANATSSMWADLLGAALSEVNWDEIAANYIEELDKTEETADAD